MKQKFKFLAETDEQLNLNIEVKAEINPLKLLQCLENIQKAVKKMQKETLQNLEIQIEQINKETI
jgi:hypothetical protein